MLSPHTIAVVKSTLPFLVERGGELTTHFYRRLFAAHPEVRPFFNAAHQQSGGQQRALAGAILAYAQNIEHPEALASALELIAHKHTSLGIQPQHYPIVGEHLLGAISELLGDAATAEILTAWGEAYNFLADVLINRERELYDGHQKSGGWEGFRPFIVTRKQPESEVITSFYLEPLDGGAVAGFSPGQYTTVRMDDSQGHTTMRNYSLSDRPGRPYYRISVKRETPMTEGSPAGYASNRLHDSIKVGDTVEVGSPCGEFVLDRQADQSRPLVLVSGGIGVTPLLSMLHWAAEQKLDRDIMFIHCAINGRSHGFADEVRSIQKAHPRVRTHVRYSRPEAADRAARRFDSEGLIDLELISELIPSLDADYYVCGPAPFMVAVLGLLEKAGVPASQLHHEFFGPASALPTAPAAA